MGLPGFKSIFKSGGPYADQASGEARFHIVGLLWDSIERGGPRGRIYSPGCGPGFELAASSLDAPATLRCL